MSVACLYTIAYTFLVMLLHLFETYGEPMVVRKLTDRLEGTDVGLLAGYFIELNSFALLKSTLGS